MDEVPTISLFQELKRWPACDSIFHRQQILAFSINVTLWVKPSICINYHRKNNHAKGCILPIGSWQKIGNLKPQQSDIGKKKADSYTKKGKKLLQADVYCTEWSGWHINKNQTCAPSTSVSQKIYTCELNLKYSDSLSVGINIEHVSRDGEVRFNRPFVQVKGTRRITHPEIKAAYQLVLRHRVVIPPSVTGYNQAIQSWRSKECFYCEFRRSRCTAAHHIRFPTTIPYMKKRRENNP